MNEVLATVTDIAFILLLLMLIAVLGLTIVNGVRRPPR